MHAHESSTELVLVDADDRELGTAEKTACHTGKGLLHRAFSVFIHDAGGRILLQQRSAAKPLWPLYWSNACCGHPRPGEPVGQAARRRVHEELGVDSRPQFLYKFRYEARYSAQFSENELCHVFESGFSGDIKPDPSEIAAWRWITPDALTREIDRYPERFSPWMKLEWPEILNRRTTP